WNSRVLRFGDGMELQDEFAADWASRDILSKPYIAVLTDGRILLTQPDSGELVLYDAGGPRIAAWQPFPESKPVGVAALPDGGFVFSDVNRNEIQVVPGSLVDSFFQ